MDQDFIIFIAVIYASIVAMSFNKVGLLPALLFPLTIVILGVIQYLIFLSYTPPPE